jgi:hypothetical protein
MTTAYVLMMMMAIRIMAVAVRRVKYSEKTKNDSQNA